MHHRREYGQVRIALCFIEVRNPRHLSRLQDERPNGATVSQDDGLLRPRSDLRPGRHHQQQRRAVVARGRCRFIERPGTPFAVVLLQLDLHYHGQPVHIAFPQHHHRIGTQLLRPQAEVLGDAHRHAGPRQFRLQAGPAHRVRGERGTLAEKRDQSLVGIARHDFRSLTWPSDTGPESGSSRVGGTRHPPCAQTAGEGASAPEVNRRFVPAPASRAPAPRSTWGPACDPRWTRPARRRPSC